MCNDYRLHVGAGTIADDFSNIKICFSVMTGPKWIDENARRAVRAEQFLRLAMQRGARMGGQAR